MARKKKHEEHVNHERWLVSYADFMTLLFAFFTSLYAISNVDRKKAGSMVFSTRQAFNMEFFPNDKPPSGTLGAVDPLDLTQLDVPKDGSKSSRGGPQKAEKPKYDTRLDRRSLKVVFQELNKLIDGGKLSGVTVTTGRDGMIVSLKDAVFFAPGSAELRPNALQALDPVIERLLETHLEIRIEGHSDDTPVRGSRYRSNWELSTARAVSVLRHLTLEFGYPPERLSVAGYASYKPKEVAKSDDPNAAATDPNQPHNRRVDLVLLTATPQRPIPTDFPAEGEAEPGADPTAPHTDPPRQSPPVVP